MDLKLRFDPLEMRAFEDMLAKGVTRGLVSALRILARDGILPATALNGVIHAGAPAAAPEPPPEPPSFGQFMEAPAAAVRPAVSEDSRTLEPKKAPRTYKPRRSYTEVAKTVAHRPNGFIPSDRACEIIGGDAAQATLRGWVIEEKTVRAVIVAEHHGAPTKGLPGRLHIETASLRERNEVRKKNATLPGAYRVKPRPLPELESPVERV